MLEPDVENLVMDLPFDVMFFNPGTADTSTALVIKETYHGIISCIRGHSSLNNLTRKQMYVIAISLYERLREVYTERLYVANNPYMSNLTDYIEAIKTIWRLDKLWFKYHDAAYRYVDKLHLDPAVVLHLIWVAETLITLPIGGDETKASDWLDYTLTTKTIDALIIANRVLYAQYVSAQAKDVAKHINPVIKKRRTRKRKTA